MGEKPDPPPPFKSSLVMTLLGLSGGFGGGGVAGTAGVVGAAVGCCGGVSEGFCSVGLGLGPAAVALPEWARRQLGLDVRSHRSREPLANTRRGAFGAQCSYFRRRSTSPLRRIHPFAVTNNSTGGLRVGEDKKAAEKAALFHQIYIGANRRSR
jgi:hypothetical protein